MLKETLDPEWMIPSSWGNLVLSKSPREALIIITYILLIFKTTLEVDAVIIPLYKQGNRLRKIKAKVTAMKWQFRDLSLGFSDSKAHRSATAPRCFWREKVLLLLVLNLSFLTRIFFLKLFLFIYPSFFCCLFLSR